MMTTTKQALVEKCDREGREARARGAAQRDCPYGDQETVARTAWLGGYHSQKQLQHCAAYSTQGGMQP